MRTTTSRASTTSTCVEGKTALVWALLGADGPLRRQGLGRAPAAAAPRARRRQAVGADALARRWRCRSGSRRCWRPTLLARLERGRRRARELPRPRAPGRPGHADRGRRRRSPSGPLAALDELADADTLAPEVGAGARVRARGRDARPRRRPARRAPPGRGGAPTRAPRGACAATRGRRRAGTSAPGMLKALGALGLALYVLAGEGRSAGEYLVGVGRPGPRAPTCSTCSTCGRAGPARRSSRSAWC